MFETIDTVPLAAPLSSAELQWIIGQCSEIQLDVGERLDEHDLTDNFYVLLDGALRGTVRSDGREVIFETPGFETGDAALLVAALRLTQIEALQPSQILRLSADAYLEQVANASPANTVLIHTLVWRMQTAEALLREREKLATLGKLAAGLAHELNNPAAAVVRMTAQLRESFEQLAAIPFGFRQRPSDMDRLSHLQDNAVDAPDSSAPRDVLAQSDREDELMRILDQHGFEDSWRIAPILVRAGVDIDALAATAESVPPDLLHDSINWTAGTATVLELMKDIEHSAKRISELVQAFKDYSYMDQAPKKDIDVHDGIESTITMLGHKLTEGISITRTYDPDLPRIQAYGSELNQVWTNLIDNAIDAVGEDGHIDIRTARDGAYILVEITDDGPGIPPEIQSRIFEPFFTTKERGAGSGLGLDISYRIVVGRHHGTIRADSQPGQTRIQVRLPIGSSS